MKIAIFDFKDWEKAELETAFKDHEIKYFNQPIHEVAIADFQDSEIIAVFVSSKVTTEIINQLPNLKMIAARSTGFDNIDLRTCAEKNITVCNVPSYGENTVAEHAFGLLLSLSRNIHKAYLRSMREDYTIEGLKGFDLENKTIGVIGAGKIGLHMIRMARGFNMNVLAYDPFPNSFLAETMNFKYASLEEILPQCDVISLHVPAMPSTNHLINRQNINSIKPGAILINTARGSIVETEALIEALDKGILAGVGLDVLEGENLIFEEKHLAFDQARQEDLSMLIKDHILLSKENVIFTPHLAFYSQEAIMRILMTSIENMQKFIAGQPINLVK